MKKTTQFKITTQRDWLLLYEDLFDKKGHVPAFGIQIHIRSTEKGASTYIEGLHPKIRYALRKVTTQLLKEGGG